MATKLIRLEDNTLVEIEVSEGETRQISGGFADKVKASINQVDELIITTCRPVISAWKELNKEMYIDQAEVEIGLAFEGEGNLYITKSKASANLTFKLVLKPKK
ncbi:MAG: hypothetical protein F6J87_31185 [Spirulina sp. SIO3F2]|nr:hypothetical protein [Spirulina sp. SIO3F2]